MQDSGSYSQWRQYWSQQSTLLARHSLDPIIDYPRLENSLGEFIQHSHNTMLINASSPSPILPRLMPLLSDFITSLCAELSSVSSSWESRLLTLERSFHPRGVMMQCQTREGRRTLIEKIAANIDTLEALAGMALGTVNLVDGLIRRLDGEVGLWIGVDLGRIVYSQLLSLRSYNILLFRIPVFVCHHILRMCLSCMMTPSLEILSMARVKTLMETLTIKGNAWRAVAEGGIRNNRYLPIDFKDQEKIEKKEIKLIEQRWKEASNVFVKQPDHTSKQQSVAIDQDTSFIPLNNTAEPSTTRFFKSTREPTTPQPAKPINKKEENLHKKSQQTMNINVIVIKPQSFTFNKEGLGEKKPEKVQSVQKRLALGLVENSLNPDSPSKSPRAQSPSKNSNKAASPQPPLLQLPLQQQREEEEGKRSMKGKGALGRVLVQKGILGARLSSRNLPSLFKCLLRCLLLNL